MRYPYWIWLLLIWPFFKDGQAQIRDSRVRDYLLPTRIVWMKGQEDQLISAEKNLLLNNIGQSAIGRGQYCIMKSTADDFSSILIDFGKELQGGIRLVSYDTGGKQVKLRIRFGESVSEAMSSIDEKGATNDHAMRDYEIDVPQWSTVQTGNTGFRFVRIDMLSPHTTLHLGEVTAMFEYRAIPYRGSFNSNDDRLNQIWQTGAYTVHLNMQEYLWDGIKRDRLVWIGDIHPEIMTINSVFGYNEVVPKSLDLAKKSTPLPGWMTGISAYSIWWILAHYDWYMYQGDLTYLREQEEYLCELLKILLTKVNTSGKETLDGWRFLDWPSTYNQKGVDAGLHALLVLGLEKGSKLCDILGREELANTCRRQTQQMKKYIPDPNQSKQGAALMAIAGLADPKVMNNDVISVEGVKNFSTFYGYYMLEAMALAGDYQGALNSIRTYWGGMLDMGATTFWEDFNIEWMENAGRIDELVPEGKKDIHGDYGDHCYVGFRHSLCHGWASGPTAWLTTHVLGIKVLDPGCERIEVSPNLGDLEWVEGTFPTPKGEVKIRHEMIHDVVKSSIEAPKGIHIIKK